jgi:putative transposase
LIKKDMETKRLNPAHEGVGWSQPALRKRWNQDKRVVATWWAENSKEAYESGLTNLAEALANWGDSKAGRRQGLKMGFPKYKRRGDGGSVRFHAGALRVDDAHHIVLPRIGRVRTKEPTNDLLKLLRSGRARILSVTLKQQAGRWYTSLSCEVEREAHPLPRRKLAAGVDVGLNHLAVIADSEGKIEYIENPKPLKKAQMGLRRSQRTLARRAKGSTRRNKAKLKVARQHARVAHQRLDAIHKLTHHLATKYQSVVVEHLNVAGMMKNHHLAQALADASFGEIRRQLTYKMLWSGGELWEADTFFPSSKKCHRCGTVRAKLSLNDRVFNCENPECLWNGDRDENAARNLLALVTRSASGTLNARGLDVSLGLRCHLVTAKLSRKTRNPWKKREAGSKVLKTSSLTLQGVSAGC